MSVSPPHRARTRLRDGACLVPTRPRRDAVAAALLLATPVLGLDTRGAHGVAGAPVPTGAPMALANGPVRAEAHLPGTRGHGPRVVPALGERLLRRPRIRADVAPVMDAVVVARPEANGRAIVPGVGPTRAGRASGDAVAPTPTEVGVAAPGMGRIIKAGAATVVAHHVPQTVVARVRVRAIGDASPARVRVAAALPSPVAPTTPA